MEWIAPLLNKIVDKLDPITLVLLLLVGACGYYHVVWRREDREDKAKLLETLNHHIEATNGLRAVLSAITGKAQ